MHDDWLNTRKNPMYIYVQIIIVFYKFNLSHTVLNKCSFLLFRMHSALFAKSASNHPMNVYQCPLSKRIWVLPTTVSSFALDFGARRLSTCKVCFRPWSGLDIGKCNVINLPHTKSCWMACSSTKHAKLVHGAQLDLTHNTLQLLDYPWKASLLTAGMKRLLIDNDLSLGRGGQNTWDWWDWCRPAPLFHSWLLLLELRSLLLLPDAQRRPPVFSWPQDSRSEKIIEKSCKNKKTPPEHKMLGLLQPTPLTLFYTPSPPNKGNHVTCLHHFWPHDSSSSAMFSIRPWSCHQLPQ